jgi:hypothetical protein
MLGRQVADAAEPKPKEVKVGGWRLQLVLTSLFCSFAALQAQAC